MYVNSMQGMVYLHKSVFQSHGNLSSANCHVDSRWVVKISGFSLHAFKKENNIDEVSGRFLLLLVMIVFIFIFIFCN